MCHPRLERGMDWSQPRAGPLVRLVPPVGDRGSLAAHPGFGRGGRMPVRLSAPAHLSVQTQSHRHICTHLAPLAAPRLATCCRPCQRQRLRRTRGGRPHRRAGCGRLLLGGGGGGGYLSVTRGHARCGLLPRVGPLRLLPRQPRRSRRRGTRASHHGRASTGAGGDQCYVGGRDRRDHRARAGEQGDDSRPDRLHAHIVPGKHGGSRLTDTTDGGKQQARTHARSVGVGARSYRCQVATRMICICHISFFRYVDLYYVP
mmetsp:Transcript_5315/g.16673  ORF Transcript_5315/g.16673 Transcript_5315/m.16673 type:complete len:259 (+) Transcript_5315:2710-3486(+)